MLGSLIQANVAERQQLIKGLEGLSQRRKADQFKELGTKFMQQGDFSPEGIQSFQQENDIDMETMMGLIKVVKQFQSIQEKEIKEPKLYRTEKGLLPTEEAEGLMPFVKPPVSPRPKTPKEIEAADLALKYRRGQIVAQERAGKEHWAGVSNRIFNQIVRTKTAEGALSRDPHTEKIIRKVARRASETMRANPDMMETTAVDIATERVEGWLKGLDRIPRADKKGTGGWGTNIEDTKTIIREIRDDVPIGDLYKRLESKDVGWTQAEIDKHFVPIIMEQEEEITEPTAPTKKLTEAEWEAAVNDILVNELGYTGGPISEDMKTRLINRLDELGITTE